MTLGNEYHAKPCIPSIKYVANTCGVSEIEAYILSKIVEMWILIFCDSGKFEKKIQVLFQILFPSVLWETRERFRHSGRCFIIVIIIIIIIIIIILRAVQVSDSKIPVILLRRRHKVSSYPYQNHRYFVTTEAH